MHTFADKYFKSTRVVKQASIGVKIVVVLLVIINNELSDECNELNNAKAY